MQPISSGARMALVFLAAAVAALAAAPPVDLPGWAAALLAAAAAGFAGIGLLPPSWTVNQEQTRAFKRGAPTRATDSSKRDVPPPPRKHSSRRASLIVAGLLALMAPAVVPSIAKANTNDLTLAAARTACTNYLRGGASSWIASHPGYFFSATTIDPHYNVSPPGNPLKWYQVGCDFKSNVTYAYDGPGGALNWHQYRVAGIVYFYGDQNGYPLPVPGLDPWWWYGGETDHACPNCWMNGWGPEGRSDGSEPSIEPTDPGNPEADQAIVDEFTG